MLREHFEIRRRTSEVEPIKRLLRRLLLLNDKGTPHLKIEMKDRLAAWGVRQDCVTRKSLAAWYWNLSDKLTKKFRWTAALRTETERDFGEVYGRITKHKIVYSCWIGPFCFDNYVPRFRGGERLSGMPTEIDGGVHEYPAKQRKDDFKDAWFARQGIAVNRIKNHEVRSGRTHKEIKDHSTLTASSSQVQQAWTKIHIETLAHWLDAAELARLIGLTPVQLTELLDLVTAHEASAKRRAARCP